MYDIERTYCARSIPEALDLLAENPGAVLTAGGTDVMIRLRERKLRRAVLISIQEIPELRFVRLDENKDLLLGPGVCFDALCANELVRSCVPLLVQACGQVGSPQIRNIATVGGNLCNGAVSADSAPPKRRATPMMWGMGSRLFFPQYWEPSTTTPSPAPPTSIWSRN